MFGSQSLELFIALITLMFVVSLAASTIVEGFRGAVNRRGQQLEASLARLLGVDLPEKSRVKRVAKAVKDTTGSSASTPEAVADALKRPESEIAAKPVIKSIQSKPGRFPSNISKATFTELVDEVKQAATPEERAKVVARFDEAMDRLSSAFKRRTSLWLFVVGLFIAVTGNVSVYRVTQTMWSDTASREAVVEASKNIGTGPDGIQAEDLTNVGKTVEQLQQVGLPVGWTADAKSEWGTDFKWGRVGIVLGWLATGALVTLGAPFWFDLLNKFIPRKASGEPPPKKPETAGAGGTGEGGAGGGV